MVVVLVVAAGRGLGVAGAGAARRAPGLVVLKRCVDVDDLLAAASAGQADAARGRARRARARPGRRRPPAPAPGAGRSRSAGAGSRRRRAAPGPPGSASTRARRRPTSTRCSAPLEPATSRGRRRPACRDRPTRRRRRPSAGRVIAVWGPAGRTGPDHRRGRPRRRALAARGLRTTLVDADPYGGAVAQQLGVLDEVSGPAQRGPAGRRAARSRRGFGVGAAGARRPPHGRHRPAPARPLGRGPGRRRRAPPRGRADARPRRRRHRVQPRGRPGRRPGLPARPQPDDPGRARAWPTRCVVVGSADPVGLSRLARGLVELRDAPAGAPVRVVVNRMRPTLGWSEQRHRRHGRGLRPAGRACTSCPTTARPSTGPWSPAALSPRPATPTWASVAAVAEALVPSPSPHRERRARLFRR